LPPSGAGSSQPDSKEAIRRAQSGPRRRPFVHSELLAQGQVLEGALAVAAVQKREESEQMGQEDDHRAKIFSGSEPTDQLLAHRRV
jgi:hypothetical protein